MSHTLYIYNHNLQAAMNKGGTILAVGDKDFVIETKAKLGAKAICRRELENQTMSH